VSPRQTRIFSGARRRANTSRATRAAAEASTAGAALSTAEDVDHAAPTLRDLLVALHTGFSSVRRKTGRLRAELVVVKSQAASSLRRMDGIAAAADGTQSESGVVLERLSKLDMLLQGLNERLPKEGGDHADGGGVAITLGLVNEIKVRPRAAHFYWPMSWLGQVLVECLSCRYFLTPCSPVICVGFFFSWSPVFVLVFFRIAICQERFLEGLMQEIRTASSSALVYPTTTVTNDRLLRAAAHVMQLSEDDAAEKLQQKMMLPVRKSAKELALVVAYQYIRRVVGHLNSALTSSAVATFVKRTHALTGMGARDARGVLKLSGEEFLELLRDDSFVNGANGRLAVLDALSSVIDEVDGTAIMVTWSGPNNAARIIRCIYGQTANVCLRVRLQQL